MEKELQALKNTLDCHLDNYQRDKEENKLIFKTLEDQNIEIINTLKPMVKTFEGSKFSLDLLISILKFLGILGSGVIALVYLTKEL